MVERSPIRLQSSQQVQPSISEAHPPAVSWPYRKVLVGLILTLLFLHLLSTAVAEGLWFQEVAYLPVFRTQLVTRLGLSTVAFGIGITWLWGNLTLAQNLTLARNLTESSSPKRTTFQSLFQKETPKSSPLSSAPDISALPQYPEPNAFNKGPAMSAVKLPGAMRLWALAITITVFGTGVVALFLYHGQVIVSHWYPELGITSNPERIPVMFRPAILWQLVQTTLKKYPWVLGAVPALLIAIDLYPRTALKTIALGMSIGLSLLLSEYWQTVLLAFHGQSFQQIDPIFSRDMGFYIFQLPVLELLAFWTTGLFLLAFLSVTLLYLLSGNSIRQGYFAGFSRPQRRHLYALASPAMGAIALVYWIDRYELLYSPTGVTYGASYTNVVAQLPINTGLSILAGLISLYFLVRSILHPGTDTVVQRSNSVGVNTTRLKIVKRSQIPEELPFYRSCKISESSKSPSSSPFFVLSVVYITATLLGSIITPPLVQRLVVQPNELEREKPYLEYTIDATRNAFNLDDIDVKVFDPKTNLTYEDLLNNSLTINNIRLWDTRPLLETNRQLQRIRLYYEFPDADIDRYTFRSDGFSRISDRPVTENILDAPTPQRPNAPTPQRPNASTPQLPTKDTRQVLIAARELDYDSVPNEAKTWVNEHLIYTHGYGFTMSPVNTATDSGLPDYFIRGIEHTASNAIVKQTIPVTNPRIYYGELTNPYIMTPTTVEELDFPSGNENVYTNYSGKGGVSIGQFWRRLLYSKYLRDWRMVLTNNFTADTKLLMRRTIGDRVRTIAPFLRYDQDPYMVVADLPADWNSNESSNQDADHLTPDVNPGQKDIPSSNLFWMIDAYTTSDRYPYSDPLANDFNYIRNSVKVVIDAYHGTVEFYVADDTDPVIQAWEQIFPEMFHPLSDMPEPLLSHIRYPQDYYQIQSEQLMTYHMTDPRVFYNREDQWRTPSEIYGTEQQPLKPYYLLMELPTEEEGEFILLHPYTPSQRRNLIAWLAARSDGVTAPKQSERNHYGKQLLYIFPKQDLVFGPEQIEARINQDPAISEQISLWNRTGSRAIQGNLLVIPIEESLLYIEPLYLEAEQDQLPTLVRVIAVYDNRIAMEENLTDALREVFNGDDTSISSVPPV
ncbi:MAG: UPF0182 family protein [Cyanobacteria bacterium P01_F01_bin.150]